MADFPALPVWTDAYLSDLLGVFTLEEHGCMFLLMQASWRRRECNLPDDDKYFCRFLGIHGNSWRRLKKSVLHRFWDTEEQHGETFWYHKRLRKERDFVRKTSEKRSENGRKGGRVARKNKDLALSPAEAPTPTPTPIKKEDTANPVSTTSPLSEKTIPTHRDAAEENSAVNVVELESKKPKRAYAFFGEVVRLSRKDFDAWEAQFHAIPDFEAELEQIDAWLVANPEKRKNWFHRASGWLNNTHQRWVRKKPKPKPIVGIPSKPEHLRKPLDSYTDGDWADLKAYEDSLSGGKNA